ncbi:MAG: hypothetical protein EOP34_01835 [Rickettsiales bacterium]|nr:MAG: hypothetical protein EOP34_01835 [Rickettsiales bacterium]
MSFTSLGIKILPLLFSLILLHIYTYLKNFLNQFEPQGGFNIPSFSPKTYLHNITSGIGIFIRTSNVCLG